MSSENIEKIDTRTRILASTWKLMEERLGVNVKMSDIAKDVGISRQAVYLHFASRTELMLATVQYVDEIKDVNARIEQIQQAQNATEQLEAFMQFWGNYIPEIYGLAKALLNTRDTDEAAASAWESCMSHLHGMSELVIQSLHAENLLVTHLQPELATELFWALVSIQNWEQLIRDCDWNTEQYIEQMTIVLKRSFIQ
ncbi:TetR/AcrR family transcriptional regulator [Alteromonas sp. a30]|uniref:TetR/AcrR family transcriptional regulator n=1 Tax=Alteromonas sp. a30 TaxID=2730917 RepID=UPI00227DD4A8|nr:TetR/AcrR family transcriptional regulator [Alteromonas sp. a30]MCY7297173.1 TetR/AcrR family transcriptional regulator [Alteromonas sp. a30]